MSLSSRARPTPANIRTRLRRINNAAANGYDMAKRWNPTGRHPRRRLELIQFFEYVERESRRLTLVNFK